MESIQVSSLFDGSPIYGREDDKKRIIGLILSDDCKTYNVTFICLVAESGTGKSVMAHLVYNEETVCDSFDDRIFICMSDMIDEKRLMMEMIFSLTSLTCREIEMEQLEELLVDELVGKKILLVLDNAWKKTPKFWNNVAALLNHCSKGSVVLVTSQSKGLGGTMHCYNLNPLSYYYCWLTFVRYAFGDLGTDANPEAVQIGKQIIAMCKNNPLCIKMVGGYLCSQNQQNWSALLKNGRWYGYDYGRVHQNPILSNCFRLVPSNLRECFKYLLLFPRDYILFKHRIIRMWISAGFIIPKMGIEPEEEGAQYFTELVSRGYIDHSPIHTAKEDMFVIPGSIYVLMLREGGSQYSSSNYNLEYLSYEKCIHFSLILAEPKSDVVNHVRNASTNLQSFLVVSNFASLFGGEFPIMKLIDLNDLFIKLGFLRTLDLSNTDLVELPCSIGLLKNLCYLGVSNTRITSLPREMCGILTLLTLEAQECSYLTELPENLKELTNLRHLDVIKKVSFVKMPIGVGQLTNLQNLQAFNVGGEIQQCGIEELKDLNHLRGTLQIAGLENIECGTSAKEASLKSKVNLETLCLQWSGTNSNGNASNAEEVLENLEPNNRLKELIVRNYVGSQFPAWMGDPSFSGLVSVIIDKCINCTKFPSFGGFPSLKNLSAQKIYHVERLETTSCRVGMNCMFPSLETLNIWEMYDLEELFVIREGDFPLLHTLSINRCPMLKNIPCFPSLKELSIYSCVKLPYVPNLPSLESLKIGDIHKMRSLDLPSNFPMLKKLEIRHCAELLLVKNILDLSSLEKLNVGRCPKFDAPNGWRRIDLNTNRCSYIKEKSTMQIKFPQQSTKMIEASSSSHMNTIREEKYQQSSSSSIPLATDLVCGAPTGYSAASSMITFESPEQSLEVGNSGLEVDEGDPIPNLKRSKLAEHINVTKVKSPVDNVDDDYTWVIYAVKLVQGTSIARSYYKCVYVGCSAKKQVERCSEDLSMVIATYNGVHSHQSQEAIKRRLSAN